MIRRVAAWIAPYTNLNVVGCVCLSLMFCTAVLLFLSYTDPLYLTATVYLVLWNSTNFTQLRSFYLNLLVITFTSVFLLMAGLLKFDSFFYPVFNTVLPKTFLLMIGIVLSNRQNDQALRLNFLLRRVLTDQVRRVLEIQDDSEMLLLTILPAPVAHRYVPHSLLAAVRGP